MIRKVRVRLECTVETVENLLCAIADAAGVSAEGGDGTLVEGPTAFPRLSVPLWPVAIGIPTLRLMNVTDDS